MTLYSIKMRAAKGGKHVSGAERILPQQKIGAAANALTERALRHGLGRAEFINIKIEEIADGELQYLEALPVSSRPASSIDAAYAAMRSILGELGLEAEADKLISLLRQARPMRGAMLYDIATARAVEPDHERGIRVTYMDAEGSDGAAGGKNHFREALVLATKVLHAPGIIAELCLSDDPEYVTGYISSLQHGYVRLSPLKEVGSPHGGRIFIFDSRRAEPEAAIAYLEKQRVLVRGLPPEQPVNDDPQQFYAEELARLRQKALYRSLRPMESAQSKYVTTRGQQVLLLSSNDYLDLANDRRVKEAAAQAALLWGGGSGGSRLTTGNTTLHEELEERLARFKGTEAALLFNTGYMANTGIIAALCDSKSVIFSDESNHASIIDGCRLSGARVVVYKHNDMQELERLLQSTSYRRGLIVSDAVFSMDGDIADLPRLTALGRKYHLLTMLDEAHATGVIGASGRGIVEHYGFSCAPDLLMGTLSKALGAEGGFACSSKTLIEYLKNKARSFIFATSQAPATLAAALQALTILEQEPWHVQRLQHNAAFFRRCLEQEGISASSPTAIIPIHIGDEASALQAAEELLSLACLIPAIRFPTVPKGSARLRAALMSSHTEAELAQAAQLISRAIK